MRMNGAQAIVKALEKEDVKVIFGIPGGASIPFYDVLYDAPIRHILVRHEQAAAHAADGYARVTGEVGVCSATSGPGATNLTTGIANAFLDSVPIVALTGQVATSFIGRDAFQETDAVGVTMSITKQNFQLRTMEDIPVIFKKAFKLAKMGRPGPVSIDMPKDVQTNEGDVEFPKDVEIPGYKPTLRGNPKQIKKAADMLMNAERPTILAGGGIIISGAASELRRLAEMLLAPVATTLMGKGAFPEEHPLALGMLGMHGRKAANYAVNDADVIFAIGCRFSDRTTAVVSLFAPEAKIIHADIDPAEIGKNVPVHLPIVGDARSILKDLLKFMEAYKKKEGTAWSKKVAQYKKEFQPFMDYDKVPLMPQRVIKEIMDVLTKDDIVVTEVGQCQMWAAHYLGRSKPKTFVSSGGLGTMGFGFPAAMGVKVAKPDNNVIDIASDGSFLMNCQELATVVKEKIPVVVAILNNHFLGMVRQWQELFFDKRYSAVNLGKVDFVDVAEAFRAKGIGVKKPGEIAPAVKEAFSSGEPTIIDIAVDPVANVYPMVPPGKGLKDIIEG
ncbi:MAG: biosynthetic-type acetolactate synthase large subunit [Candidatus Hydrothermarchaeaceae archaeon]